MATKFPGIRFSELAAGLAGLEYKHGKRRTAQKLISKSLVEPTENSAAQALWYNAAKNMDINSASHMALSEFAYEAGVYKAIARRDTGSAIQNSRRWLDDEPFSARPALSGSFFCLAHLYDQEAALSFVTRGLQANPDDPMLLNNMLVANARMDNFEEVCRIFEKLRRYENDPSFRAVFLAAKGLVAFRKGRNAEGQEYYYDANLFARTHQYPVQAFLAGAYWLEQEVMLGLHGSSFVYKAIEHLGSQLQMINRKDKYLIEFTWETMKNRLLLVLGEQTSEPVLGDYENHKLFRVSVV